MMKRIVLGLLITLCFFSDAKAQPLSTNIRRIEIDGREIQTNYKVFFLLNGEWLRSERTPTGFIIPGELRNEEYLTVLITFGKHRLEFVRVHHSKFTEDWIVGIDEKPFSEENVAPEEANTVKRVYYIVFEGIGLDTRLVVIEHKNK